VIAKPFNKPKPPPQVDPTHKAGWVAEQDAAFRLDRAFGDPARKEVRILHDIRLPATFASGAIAPDDYFQIDHLVLHRHGMALVESKSVYGDLHVDQLGQWQRRSSGRSTNIPSPVTQVQQQATALRRLCQSSASILLNKLLGIAQKGFGHFPATPFVAIASTGRFTGATGTYEAVVMKVDRIAAAVEGEIERHRSRAGVLGIVRGAIARDDSDAGTFKLKLDEVDRIEQFLLARHTPLMQPQSDAIVTRTKSPSGASVPATASNRERVERLEALACSKCRSVNVKVIYARDYCLKCDECGKFSSLPYLCPLCGKHATIRRNGQDHLRECDGGGGCGTQTVFWRPATNAG
jgi:hypothetical protein